MNRDERDRLLEEGVRRELEEAAAGLDHDILGRLRQARQRALTGAGRGRQWSFLLQFFPRRVSAGGLAAAAVVVIAVSFWAATARTPLQPRQPEDLDIITSQEHLDLYADLEFYRWLAADEDGR